jgi:uncharacterized membrane protein
MPVAENSIRKARWYLIPVRVLLVTFVVTLLSFAVSLFFGILGTLLVARLRGVRPNLVIAYRHIAIPVAAVAGVIVIVSATVMEIQRYRQLKTLLQLEHQMERAS